MRGACMDGCGQGLGCRVNVRWRSLADVLVRVEVVVAAVAVVFGVRVRGVRVRVVRGGVRVEVGVGNLVVGPEVHVGHHGRVVRHGPAVREAWTTPEPPGPGTPCRALQDRDGAHGAGHGPHGIRVHEARDGGHLAGGVVHGHLSGRVPCHPHPRACNSGVTQLALGLYPRRHGRSTQVPFQPQACTSSVQSRQLASQRKHARHPIQRRRRRLAARGDAPSCMGPRGSSHRGRETARIPWRRQQSGAGDPLPGGER